MRKPVLAAFLLILCACDNTPKQKQSSGPNDSIPKAATPPPPSAPAAAPADSASKIAAWLKFVKPGDQHKFLASANGDWNVEMSFYQQEGSAPMVMTSKCTNRMIMGDRYQQSTYKGVINSQPFEASSLMGYDNARKLFFTTWVDNMGTGLSYMEGPWDTTTKSLTLRGKQTDHETGGQVDVRSEVKFLGPNVITKEMFVNRNGQEYKYVDIKMTRKNPVQ